MIGDADIRKSLREVAEFLRMRAEDSCYGYARPDNPHDFFPDSECCSPEEIAAHKAACDAWDRGEYTPPQPPTREEIAASLAKPTPHLPGTVDAVTLGPNDHLHICFAPWGIGTYVLRDEQMIAMAARLDLIADEMTGAEAV